MKMKILLLLINAVLINVAFLLSYLARYGPSFPEYNFLPYKNSFAFLTLIYLLALIFFKIYKSRFKSSWDLFSKCASGLFFGTLANMAFVYIFRTKLSGFPSSVFVIVFFINLFLIFKVNHFVLKAKKKIKKQMIILGEGKVDDIVGRKANVERKHIDQINDLLKYPYIDEIVISEKITNTEYLNLLLYLKQILKADILFSPSVYMELLPGKINGNYSAEMLGTLVGRKSDLDEFCIIILDILISLILLILAAVPMLIISVLVKLTSRGSVIYKQERVGKDGKTFILYKFRTMTKDAEKKVGPVLAEKNDPRITKIGKILRTTRMDELPQLFNIMRGQMSLVGPRPERVHFIKMHKALQGIRLAVKPGLTGLAQIRSFYNLHPKHKIKYDYLYIQQRSFGLNLKILLQTIPVIFSKKGW